MWVSDACFYAIDALKLHQAWSRGVSEWWISMLSVNPKPPVLSWVGQFFVPVGELIGNVDSGLLFVNIIAQYVTLVLLYHAFIQFFENRRLALLGCLIVAAAPVSFGISKQYYVQAVQLTAVAWFIYIMAHLRNWDGLYTLLQLITAGAFSLLTMLSTPLLCLMPAGAAFLHVLRTYRTPFKTKHALWLVVALIVSVPTVLWYLRNYSQAVEYAQFGYSYRFGGFIDASYLMRFAIWIYFLFRGALLPWAAVVIILAAVCVFFARAKKQFQINCAVTSALKLTAAQIMIAIVIFALSVQQESRYVLPLMAYLSLIVAWFLLKLNNKHFSTLLASVFLGQWLVLSCGSFGVGETGWLQARPLQREPDRRQHLMDNIIHLTDGAGGQTVLLALGGLDFYSLEVEYNQAKKGHDIPNTRGIRYDCVEFMLTRPEIDGNIERAWTEIMKAKPGCVIILNHALRSTTRLRAAQISQSSGGWAVVMKGTMDLSEKIAGSPQYLKIEWPECPELEAYQYRGPL
jgi:hypothetical protein